VVNSSTTIEVATSVKHALPSHAPIRFGVFELDPQSGELRKQGAKIRLQEQPFQILQILLEHQGKVVTREELRQRIWSSDTFVDFNQGLYNATKKLREALGDSAESPRFIETLSRRGYRFIAAVDSNGSAVHSGEPSKPETRPEVTGSGRIVRISIALGFGVAILLGTVLGQGRVWRRLPRTSTVPQIRSIAVLPLENLSGDSTQEYFSEGMTDALITDLAQIGALQVISRTSSMQYKGVGKKSLPEIARELNVDGIVEGTVQRSGDRVRITAQLIHGTSDKHLWANSYERDMRDVFALERDLADDIAHQIRAQIVSEKEGRTVEARPVNLEALEAYLQGNSHLAKADTGPRDEELRKAAEYFQRAIDAEPTFAPAYIGMSEAHHDLWWPSSEDFVIMRASAEKSLKLAPSSSDAHLAVGVTKSEDWEWAEAEEEYRRAIALSPNSALAHECLGSTLDQLGKMDEGWKEDEITQELDPNQDHLSEALYLRGQYDRAIELLREMAERRPGDGVIHWKLSESYLRKGLYQEWAQEISKTMSVFGFPQVANRIRRAFVNSGYPGALRQWAGELEHLAANKQSYFPGILGEVYGALGDKDRAFYWLEQGCEHRYMAISDPVLVWLKVDPGFAPLRSDPRFKDMLRRMSLPP
jgi:TolB-like protein/DNA-binding winged helix-turn-helix (wHTH) protein